MARIRNRVRIQPYVTPEIRRKLAAYSAAQDVTESAVAEAALAEYFQRDKADEGPFLRRLDLVTQAVSRIQGEIEIVAGALARFINYSFLIAPAAPPAGGKGRADVLYREFLAAVSHDLARGVTLAGAVGRCRVAPVTATPKPGTQAGGGTVGKEKIP